MVFLGSGERAQHVQLVRNGAGLGTRQVLVLAAEGSPSPVLCFLSIGDVKAVEPISASCGCHLCSSLHGGVSRLLG